MKKNFIFVVMLFVVVVCVPVAVLAKESVTEECDAVTIEQVLNQARGITASVAFLPEILPTLNDTKKVVKDLVAEQNMESAENSQREEEALIEGKKKYDEAVHRYFRRNSRSNPKND